MPEIAMVVSSPKNIGRVEGENAVGRSASFTCGINIRFSLRIEDGGHIADGQFQTNGCGYLIAAADKLSDWITGKKLKDLHGLESARPIVADKTEAVNQDDRVHCRETAFEALKEALADYRRRVVEEFRGETALICTCFSVSEETILAVISGNDIEDAADVADKCNAGAGCGSCRMLIQELIDMKRVGA